MDNDISPPPPPPVEPPAVPAPVAATAEDKTVAIVAYLTLIGFIVAVVLQSNKKTAIGAYHLRQSLGLVLSGIILSVVGVIPFLGWLVFVVGWILLFVMWIFGLINAINGQEKPVPILGPTFEKWFATAF
jgi:uncharacterized membrane protein